MGGKRTYRPRSKRLAAIITARVQSDGVIFFKKQIGILFQKIGK
jgi:hypothetical protein